MHITHIQSIAKIDLFKEEDVDERAFIEVVKLIEKISKDKCEIKNIKVDFIIFPHSFDKLNISRNRSLMLFESMIKNYTESNEYNEHKKEAKLLDLINEQEKNKPKKKNYIISRRIIYTIRMFNYIRGNKIFDKLSNDKIYILVGKLMVVSGLDKEYDIENEKTLQGRIKKRINP